MYKKWLLMFLMTFDLWFDKWFGFVFKVTPCNVLNYIPYVLSLPWNSFGESWHIANNLVCICLITTYIICDLKINSYAFETLIDSTFIQTYARPVLLAIHQQSQLPRSRNDVIHLRVLTETDKCVETARFWLSPFGKAPSFSD